MENAGFDMIGEVNPRFVNKLLFAAQCSGAFKRQKTGTYILPVTNVPEAWSALASLNYQLDFDVPSVKSTTAGRVAICIPTIGHFSIANDVTFDVKCVTTADGAAVLNERVNGMLVDFSRTEIGTVLSNDRLPKSVAGALTDIMNILMKEYLVQDVSQVVVSPTLVNGALPDASGQLSIVSEGVTSASDFVAASFGFNAAGSGDLGRVSDFTNGNDCAAFVSADGVKKALEFWWRNKTVSVTKTETQTSRLDLRLIDAFWDTAIGVIAGVLGGAIEWVIGLIVSLMIRFEQRRRETSTKVTYLEPSITCLDGNKAVLRGTVNVECGLKVIYQIKELFSEFPRWKTHNLVILNLPGPSMAYEYEATGNFRAGRGNCLELNLTNWQISLSTGFSDFLGKWKEYLEVAVTADITHAIINARPQFVFSPALIPGGPISEKLSVSLISPRVVSDARGACLRVGCRIQGLQQCCNAPYLANKNPSSLEVHKAECVWIKKTAQKHRVPYYFLDEAHSDGYDNCFYCLGGSAR